MKAEIKGNETKTDKCMWTEATKRKKTPTEALQETLMYEINFQGVKLYGCKRDYKISKEQGGQQENRRTKGNLCSSVGNISGTFHIQANKVPTFRP